VSTSFTFGDSGEVRSSVHVRRATLTLTLTVISKEALLRSGQVRSILSITLPMWWTHFSRMTCPSVEGTAVGTVPSTDDVHWVPFLLLKVRQKSHRFHRPRPPQHPHHHHHWHSFFLLQHPPQRRLVTAVQGCSLERRALSHPTARAHSVAHICIYFLSDGSSNLVVFADCEADGTTLCVAVSYCLFPADATPAKELVIF
jgi:hypothetical protein